MSLDEWDIGYEDGYNGRPKKDRLKNSSYNDGYQSGVDERYNGNFVYENPLKKINRNKSEN